jgi:kynurenine formamidase
MRDFALNIIGKLSFKDAYNQWRETMKKLFVYPILSVFLFFMVAADVLVTGKNPLKMEEIIDFLQNKTFVDLTHAFSPSIPIPDGFPKPKREAIYDGAVQIFTHVGQYGTHLDAPGHFHKGMRLVESISVNEFVLEGCTIDISKQSANNHDYKVQLVDVRNWEKRNGLIPAGSIVILRTDWSKRWSDPQGFFNKDEKGQKHYPGWGMEALKYLIDERKIQAIAHETPDTDSGITCGMDKGWPLEAYVLKQNLWQIENLNNAEKLPPKNFLVFVGVPKADKATGFPVRVIAILP